MNALLTVDNWSISLKTKKGYQPYLAKLSFEIQAAEILGLVGPSGTGKSLTLHSLLGLCEPALTRIEGPAAMIFGGQVIGRVGHSYRQHCRAVRPLLRGPIGMIFQQQKLLMNPLKTVGQHFRDAARLYGQSNDLERNLAVLQEVGCGITSANQNQWLQKSAHQLSGGEVQRIQIALVLINPDLRLLVCDEVTSNLDEHLQWRIVRLIHRLNQRRGLAVLFVSHDSAKVAQLSDRVMGLHQQSGACRKHYLIGKKTYLGRLEQEQPFSHHNDQPSPGQEPPAIEVRGLSKWYGQQQVLHQVSLTVAQGERYALIGASGSGKTTLARMIAGILTMAHSEGQLKIFGTDRKALAINKDGVIMVYQNFAEALNPYMTVATHLKQLTDKVAAAEPQQAEAWLKRLGIEHVLDLQPAKMSGGEGRRFALVESLSLKPRLVLADEPTAGLDRENQRLVLQQLERYRHEQGAFTALLISHDLRLVGAYASRVGVLYAGHLLQETTTAELFSDPPAQQHPYTELLLNAHQQEYPEPPPAEANSGCIYYQACHRKDKVACAYRHIPPPRTQTAHGWSSCPYPHTEHTPKRPQTNRPTQPKTKHKPNTEHHSQPATACAVSN